MKAKQYRVSYKNVFTKHKWSIKGVYSSPATADAEANYLRNQKFIMGRDFSGEKRPSPKTLTRITVVGN